MTQIPNPPGVPPPGIGTPGRIDHTPTAKGCLVGIVIVLTTPLVLAVFIPLTVFAVRWWGLT